MSEVPLGKIVVYERETPVHRGTEPPYRGTSLARRRTPLGPYRRPMPRVLGGTQGGGLFFMSEVPLYQKTLLARNIAFAIRTFDLACHQRLDEYLLVNLTCSRDPLHVLFTTVCRISDSHVHTPARDWYIFLETLRL